MAGVGRGDMGLNKQPRQVTTTSHALRDVRQSLKQLHLQVGSHPTNSNQQQNDQCAGFMITSDSHPSSSTWNANYTPHQDSKRSTRHAKALMEIKNSLQSYEVGGGDVDRALLEQCVALGFEEDLARETLKANRDKDFTVVLATLKSMTEVSGRKFIKNIVPGTLQYARSNPPTSVASSQGNIPRARLDASGSVQAQNSKLYGMQQANNWSQSSSTAPNVNNVYIKSPVLAPTRTVNNSQYIIRKQGHDVGAKQGASSNDPIRVDRTQQFNVTERKISEGTMTNYQEVRLRQNRPTNRDAQKRWSADVLQKVKAFELENKRSSLAFEVGEQTVFDVPNKPPPPYPGPNPADARHEPWYCGPTFVPNIGSSMVKRPSMENMTKIGLDPVRMHGTDMRKTYSPQEHVEHNVSAPPPLAAMKNQELPMYANKNMGKQMSHRDPPPYHVHRPIQRTYSPSERPAQSSKTYSAVPPQPVYQQNTQAWIPNEAMMNSFVPIKQTRLADSNYAYGGDEDVSSHGSSPPPYHSFDQVTSSSDEKRLSYTSDVDSSSSSKRASIVFNDEFVMQSDSSGSASPTAEKIESRYSPLPQTNSPYHTLVIRNDIKEGERCSVEADVCKDEEPYNSRLKSCSTQAFKFYMEQHYENVLKSRRLREKRKNQLEIEMKRVGLSGESQTEMRKMLVQKESNYIRMKRSKMSKSLFTKVKTLGMGAFGEVALVRKNDSNALYAMKTLRKADVLKRNQVAHVKAERDILAEADNEWVVKLYYSFQDATNLYFVMEYVPGGDLMALLIKLGIFSHELARFYTAELVLAVESVHKLGFIHRDIKPDNVLIDRNGHIKLTDFGLCTGFRWTHDSKYYQQDPTHARQPSMEPEGGWEQMLMDGPCDCGDIIKKFDFCKPLDRRAARQHMRCLAHSLVGTPNYIAPEVLLRIPYTQLCDWWSVGVILYEMLVGQPPFLATSPAETQMRVIYWQNTLRIPKHAKLSAEAENLITNLCVNPERRLGTRGTDEIKKHPFFAGVDWVNCLKNDPAPYKPMIRHATDTSNFDPVPEKEINEELDDAIIEEKRKIIEKGPQHAFYEFTFRRFFDEGGHPQEITMEDDVRGASNGQQNSNVTLQNNKRTATQSDKSVTVPNKVAAPPSMLPLKLDDKAPVYV
eukprot:gene256-877_t